MAVADPVSPAFALVDSTLTGDATMMSLVSTVCQDQAPPGTLPEYVLMGLMSAPDTNSATGVRILTRNLLQIKVVGPAKDGANIRAAFARMDGLLQPNGQPLRNQGGTLALFRESVLSYSEDVNGTQWVNLGGLYRVEV